MKDYFILKPKYIDIDNYDTFIIMKEKFLFDPKDGSVHHLKSGMMYTKKKFKKVVFAKRYLTRVIDEDKIKQLNYWIELIISLQKAIKV